MNPNLHTLVGTQLYTDEYGRSHIKVAPDEFNRYRKLCENEGNVPMKSPDMIIIKNGDSSLDDSIVAIRVELKYYCFAKHEDGAVIEGVMLTYKTLIQKVVRKKHWIRCFNRCIDEMESRTRLLTATNTDNQTQRFVSWYHQNALSEDPDFSSCQN